MDGGETQWKNDIEAEDWEEGKESDFASWDLPNYEITVA